MAFIGLSIIGELPWWVTVVILVREWGITAMRFVMLRYGVMAANRGGKIKTVLQAVALILYLLPLPGSGPLHWFAVIVMAAAFVVTVVTGLGLHPRGGQAATAGHRAARMSAAECRGAETARWRRPSWPRCGSGRRPWPRPSR